MFRHYFTSALRTFWKRRFATLMNLLCLALGITCFAITYAVAGFLGDSDRQFSNADRVYVLTVNFRNPVLDVQFEDCPCTGPVAAELLRAQFPQLHTARLSRESYPSVAAEDKAIRAAVSYADPHFYDIFDLPLRPGADPAALRSPRGAVIAEDAALRLFGSTDVVGRRLTILSREEVTIAGVMKPLPQPTQFKFEILAPMAVRDLLDAARGHRPASAGELRGWFDQRDMFSTYVLLPKDGSLSRAQFERELAAFSARHIPKMNGPTLELGVIPAGAAAISMTNAQLNAFTGSGLTVQGVGYAMAALVLLIACVNYANLAAALANARAREIGMRAVMGAGRMQLISQHLFEAAVIGAAAVVLVLVLALLLTPVVARFGVDLPVLFALRPQFLGLVVGLIAAVALVGGAYPALVLSSIRPRHVLRAAGTHSGSRFAPTLLVGVQFAAASFLLILVIIAHGQNQAVLSAGRQLAKEPVVTFSSSLAGANVSFEALRARLMQSPHVQAVTASSDPPLSFIGRNTAVGHQPDHAAARTTVSFTGVTYGFLETFNLPLLAGRDFARDRADDAFPRDSCKATQPVRVIIGQTLARQLGWNDPQDAVDKIVYLPMGVCPGAAPPVQIVGVIEDRPLAVMGMGSRSSMYVMNHPDEPMYASVRLARGDIQAALAHVDAVWKELAPKDSGERTLLSDAFSDAYRKLLGATTMLLIAPAFFALTIAGVGLLGMTIHATDRRRHEIGVRKTLGARTGQIVWRMLRDLSAPVLIANVIAWPFAWIAGQMYRGLFVDQTALTIAPFAAALVITLATALVVAGGRTLRAAQVKPAEVLRYE